MVNSKQELTLNNIQEVVDNWIKTVGVRYYSELTNMAILTEEVGEVARLMARKYGDQSFKKHEVNKELGEEIADVFFVLTCIANQTGINLEKEFIKSMEKRTKRDTERHRNNPKLQ